MWREVVLPLHAGTINNGLLRWKCWLLEPVGAGIDSEPSGALFGRLWKDVRLWVTTSLSVMQIVVG